MLVAARCDCTYQKNSQQIERGKRCEVINLGTPDAPLHFSRSCLSIPFILLGSLKWDEKVIMETCAQNLLKLVSEFAAIEGYSWLFIFAHTQCG